MQSLFLVAAMAAATSSWAADTYTIDPVSSIPAFQVVHLGFTTQRGRFNRVTGKVTLDIAARKGSVEFRIDTKSLDMGSESWTAHLSDEGLFNTANFPTITFKSDRLVFDGARVVGADGTLTMIGVTKPVHLDVQRFTCGPHPQNKRQVCGGDVSATLRRSDFGLVKYVEAVSDEVRIDVPVLAYKD
jgi:polyisoprenoid-binding protein YceI